MDKGKNLIIGILVILLGVSVYFNFQKENVPSEQQNKAPQTSRLSDDDLFQKKQECQQYREQIEAKLKELAFFNPDTGYQSTSFLEKLFFSPKANTCLYVVKEWGLVNKKLTWETLTLNDALTGEILTSSLREVGNKDYLQRKQAFEEYLKDYE